MTPNEKSLLITGAAGFVGSHLVRKALQQGYSVTCLVRPSSDLWRIVDILGQVELFYCDMALTDVKKLSERIGNVSHVFHLAAAGVNPKGHTTYSLAKENILGTINLLQASMNAQLARFVYFGSCFEYGVGRRINESSKIAPSSEYGLSKATASAYVQFFSEHYNVPTTILRPFNVYGPMESRNRLIPTVILGMLTGKPIQLTEGRQLRDFVHVYDAVDACLAASSGSATLNEVLNICTGEAHSVKQVVDLIASSVDYPVELAWGAHSYHSKEYQSLSGCPIKAESLMNWRASIDIETGLQQTFTWFRENYKNFSIYF